MIESAVDLISAVKHMVIDKLDRSPVTAMIDGLIVITFSVFEL